MSKLVIMGDKLDTIRPGDVVLSINGTAVTPRTVEAALDNGAIRYANPNPASELVCNLYADNLRVVVIDRPASGKVRRFTKPEAAAKAWGNAHGIINRGGTLYWDAETIEEAQQLAEGTTLGVKAIYGSYMGRKALNSLMVTGYGQSGHRKGWEALAPRLIRKSIVALVDGKYEVQA